MCNAIKRFNLTVSNDWRPTSGHIYWSINCPGAKYLEAPILDQIEFLDTLKQVNQVTHLKLYSSHRCFSSAIESYENCENLQSEIANFWKLEVRLEM